MVLTAGPLGMVPPVNAGTFLGTEGCVGLYTGTLHTRARHKAAIKQAGFIVVLGRHERMALGKQATQGERGHTLVSTPASSHASQASLPSWNLLRGTRQRGTMATATEDRKFWLLEKEGQVPVPSGV